MGLKNITGDELSRELPTWALLLLALQPLDLSTRSLFTILPEEVEVVLLVGN